jgi:hypothetical protein
MLEAAFDDLSSAVHNAHEANVPVKLDNPVGKVAPLH